MIVIPMAGKSSRFYNEGFKIPKFKLAVFGGSNVFSESLKSFADYFCSETFLFIHRKDDDSGTFIKKQCEMLQIKNFILKELNSETRGQAETVAIGLSELEFNILEKSIYIFNIDSFLLDFKKPSVEFLADTNGYLELFRGKGDHWSFAQVDGNYVTRTSEKVRISDLCSNGLYYFSSAKLFLQTFEKLEKKNEYQELFIAPMYNFLIDANLKVKYSIITKDDILFCGTPGEYELLNN